MRHALMGDEEHEIVPVALTVDNGQIVTICKACGLHLALGSAENPRVPIVGESP